MKYRAFKMKLKPGCIVEYKKRHDLIWPELVEQFKKQRINSYRIWVDEETHALFAYQEMQCDSIENHQNLDLMQRWWDYMADLMVVHPKNNPVVTQLKEVFCMEEISI
ncbi:L-rhamnose mutarotase [Aurantibacter crassamenti]|uniref:L-rhamnose mutarotase n=1 Tax=Aurantibacter crassamenti TaxID=1837375 RepID=UPI0019393C43|nr:L-rhamnose mutarotase [Aurantibacter crassamenti]MBM1106260.1 L-rhamnose mutarotase [Aurantibacter crassamenti]